MKHEKLPWIAYEDQDKPRVWIDTNDGDYCVAEVYSAEASDIKNAQFIVKAVNNHDKLVEACKKAYKELNEIRARDGVPYTHQGMKSSVAREYFDSVVNELEQALKDVEKP